METCPKSQGAISSSKGEIVRRERCEPILEVSNKPIPFQIHHSESRTRVQEPNLLLDPTTLWIPRNHQYFILMNDLLSLFQRSPISNEENMIL